MQKMHCSFEDETQFYDNFQKESDGHLIAFNTQSDSRMRVFEAVSVGLNIRNIGVSSRMRGRIVRRKPMAMATPDTQQMWEYTIRLDAEDKIWFEAFVNNVETHSKFKA